MNSLPQTSILVATLFHFYTDYYPPQSYRFIYAEDICCTNHA